MTTCVSSVNTHTVYWPQWRFLVVLNADLEQFWVQAGVRRVHFLRLSGCPSADPRLFATFWACIVTAGAWSRRGYGVVICGYGVVTARLLTRHNAVTKIYNVHYSITLAPLDKRAVGTRRLPTKAASRADWCCPSSVLRQPASGRTPSRPTSAPGVGDAIHVCGAHRQLLVQKDGRQG